MARDLTQLVEQLKDEIREAVAEIKNDPQMGQITSLHNALNALEGSAGMRKTPLADLFAFPEAGLSIRSDEFYGFEPLEAAKRYLRKKGEGASFQEIVGAIRSGGCTASSEEELQNSLIRSTYQIAKISDGVFGLVEFYPHLKRGKKKRANGKEQGQEADTDKAEAPEPAEPEAES